MKQPSLNKRNEPQKAGRTAAILTIGLGIVVILLGLYGMVRPNLLMPAKREDLQIGGRRVLMETRRVVTVPRALSALVMVCGAGLIFIGVQKPAGG